MVPSPFELAGYVVTDEFLSTGDCRQLLGRIDDYRSTTDLPEIHRTAKGRNLRYLVIDGYEIKERLADIWDLYTGSVRTYVSEVAGEEMFPLQNLRAGVNVNVMQPGNSEYRWHYDRTPVTAVLYLNEVEGGATELYPNLRVLLGDQRRIRTQRTLDRMVSTRLGRAMRAEKVVVAPQARRLVAMAGNRCWHSVSGVRGSDDRINIILAYDRKDAMFAAEQGLDSYLYTNDQTAQKDPNYLR
jgi:hypothetical protein